MQILLAGASFGTGAEALRSFDNRITRYVRRHRSWRRLVLVLFVALSMLSGYFGDRWFEISRSNLPLNSASANLDAGILLLDVVPVLLMLCGGGLAVAFIGLAGNFFKKDAEGKWLWCFVLRVSGVMALGALLALVAAPFFIARFNSVDLPVMDRAGRAESLIAHFAPSEKALVLTRIAQDRASVEGDSQSVARVLTIFAELPSKYQSSIAAFLVRGVCNDVSTGRFLQAPVRALDGFSS